MADGNEIYDLKKLLGDESGGVEMSDELFERFMAQTTELTLKNKEPLIPAGKVDTNLYIQKTGILRACYWDGEYEKTYGFALPGTVVVSYHSYFMRRPAFFQIESCGETTVLKISKRQLTELIGSSNEFAKWFIAVQSGQLYLNEFKHAAITGTAKERYLQLIKKRPEIIRRVPSKIIASYLGVTPTYLSYVKKMLREED